MDLKEFLTRRKKVTGASFESFAKKLCITKQHLSKIMNKVYCPGRLLAKKIEYFTHGQVSCLELLYPEDKRD
jgi:DNA-binding transcriptional regulator YdaS (Cro superfamily)